MGDLPRSRRLRVSRTRRAMARRSVGDGKESARREVGKKGSDARRTVILRDIAPYGAMIYKKSVLPSNQFAGKTFGGIV